MEKILKEYGCSSQYLSNDVLIILQLPEMIKNRVYMHYESGRLLCLHECMDNCGKHVVRYIIS
jgi:hypothetical protein